MEELSGFYSVKMDTFLSDPASALSRESGGRIPGGATRRGATPALGRAFFCNFQYFKIFAVNSRPWLSAARRRPGAEGGGTRDGGRASHASWPQRRAPAAAAVTGPPGETSEAFAASGERQKRQPATISSAVVAVQRLAQRGGHGRS